MEVRSHHPSHDPLQDGSKKAQVAVVMVPFVAQSHLNQLLHLSCLISSYKIPVHYACSATHIHQVKIRFNDMNRLDQSQIQFHSLPTPPFSSPPPDPNAPTKFPTHLHPSFLATKFLREPMADLLRQISHTATRVVVVHDVLMCYVVQDIATIPNAESYVFNPISAFVNYFSGRQVRGEKPQGLPSTDGDETQEIKDLINLQADFYQLRSGIIFNSCRPIEGPYIGYLEKEQNSMNKKLWAIGPLNQRTISPNWVSSKSQDKCFDWLNKQAPKSVLYVSFGTTTSMTDEQIKELAEGLEQSKEKFIWVFRDADKGDIFVKDVKSTSTSTAELPKGYEERVKKHGLVTRDWAPQMEILGHPSTGGFMSHCGWNSCLESITMGVPMATWPMHSDQPMNAFLVTNVLKAGLTVNRWENRKEVVNSSAIAEAVKRLMGSKEGEEMRRRAEELGVATRRAVEEGGVSRLELDSFVAHVTK